MLPVMAGHIPTPNTSHLSQEDYLFIYEPAEDSFLLLDALEKDENLIKEKRPLLCVEIGSGSGVVITFLASILKTTAFYISTDINARSVTATSATLKQNGVTNYDCIHEDLLTSLIPRLHNNIDVLVFNPPYVPTSSSEVGGDGIEASWAGGENGRQVINRVIPDVSKLLSDNGLFYLLLLQENNPDELQSILHKEGLSSKVVLRRKAGREHLCVIRFYKDVILY